MRHSVLFLAASILGFNAAASHAAVSSAGQLSNVGYALTGGLTIASVKISSYSSAFHSPLQNGDANYVSTLTGTTLSAVGTSQASSDGLARTSGSIAGSSFTNLALSVDGSMDLAGYRYGSTEDVQVTFTLAPNSTVQFHETFDAQTTPIVAGSFGANTVTGGLYVYVPGGVSTYQAYTFQDGQAGEKQFSTLIFTSFTTPVTISLEAWVTIDSYDSVTGPPPPAVPEPGTAALAAAGLAGLVWRRRTKSTNRNAGLICYR